MNCNTFAGRLLAVTAISISLLAACSSPAVTGMKVHMQNQEYAETIHLADSVIADGDSLNAEVWLWRGRAQANLNDWVGASESFIKVHSLDPSVDLSDYWFAFYNGSVTLMGEEEIQGALGLLNAGRMIMPDDPNFDLLLGDIELNVNSDREAALANFMAAGEKGLTRIGVLNEAMEETEDPYMMDYYLQILGQTELIAIQGFFNSGSVLSMMALSADETEAANLRQQAREVYERALAIDQTNIDVLEAIAECEMLEGDYEAALAIYDDAFVQIDLGVTEGWLTPEEADQLKANMMVSKGFAYIEMEQFDQAISELDAARSLIGDDFVVLATLAHAQFMMEDYHSSLGALETALSFEGLSPQDLASAYQMRFACYSRLEMDAEAAVALESALNYDPDNAGYWELLASTYSRLGRRQDAIDAMQRAEELSGN